MADPKEVDVQVVLTPSGNPKRNNAGAVFSAMRWNLHAADAAARFPAAALGAVSRAPTR